MKRLVVGISGATGAIYGVRLLEVLQRDTDIEVHLVMSDAAALTIEEETEWNVSDVLALADYVHEFNNIGAPISSGSFLCDGMVIAPCSIKSMAMISNSINANLLVRSADVTLKEKRKLVLLLRETPLHLGHLRLMTNLAEIGATICPPMPSFYHKPKSLNDIIDHTVGKLLDQFGISQNLFKRWSGMERTAIKPMKRRIGKV